MDWIHEYIFDVYVKPYMKGFEKQFFAQLCERYPTTLWVIFLVYQLLQKRNIYVRTEIQKARSGSKDGNPTAIINRIHDA